MRYRVVMSIAIEAQNDRQAHEHAMKLKKLLESPIVRLTVEGDGIQLSDGDGRPVVHQPQRVSL